MSITQKFNSFAGKEVDVIEADGYLSINGNGLSFGRRRVLDEDPTVQEMRAVAEEHGMVLRLWFSKAVSSCDYRTDRLNAYVVKGRDGRYRIGKDFHVG